MFLDDLKRTFYFLVYLKQKRFWTLFGFVFARTLEWVNVGRRHSMLHLFFKCFFQIFTFTSLNRWVLGMSLPRRLNRYDYLYWLIAYCGLNYLGRSCLLVVFSPLDTHVGICTCGIIASWKYRQHPLDLRGFCSVYELETCLDFQRLEKSTLSPCPGDSSTSLAVGALLLFATFCLNTEVPQTHSCPVYLCALPQLELLWAVGCVCVCVRCHRTPSRCCISWPHSLLGGAPVLASNALHRLLLLWCASAEQSHIPLYIFVLLRHLCTPDPW